MKAQAGLDGAALALAVVIVVVCLASCGNDGSDDNGSAATTAPSTEAGPVAEKIVIKTHIEGFTGEVLAGSVLGDAPFCAGGTVRHEHGSPDIGFPAVNVLDCQGGSLRIGFGPGPSQMDQMVQTSDWAVLDGTGTSQGSPRRARCGSGSRTRRPRSGRRAFTGVVAVP